MCVHGCMLVLSCLCSVCCIWLCDMHSLCVWLFCADLFIVLCGYICWLVFFEAKISRQSYLWYLIKVLCVCQVIFGIWSKLCVCVCVRHLQQTWHHVVSQRLQAWYGCDIVTIVLTLFLLNNVYQYSWCIFSSMNSLKDSLSKLEGKKQCLCFVASLMLAFCPNITSVIVQISFLWSVVLFVCLLLSRERCFHRKYGYVLECISLLLIFCVIFFSEHL